MVGIPAQPFVVLGITQTLKDYIAESSGNNALIDTAKEFLDFSNYADAYQNAINLFLSSGGPILTIAFSLIAIYFLTGIIDDYLMSGREIDMQAMIRMGCAIVVADIIVNLSPTIISTVLNLSATMLSETAELISEATDSPEMPTLPDANILELMIAALLTLFVHVLSEVPALFLSVILFSTQLEIVLRCIFAPIGLAGFANNSHRHEASRYLRKMIASALYASAILITIYVALTISKAMQTNGTDITDPSSALAWVNAKAAYIIRQLIAPFAAIGAISTVKGLINEALGA